VPFSVQGNTHARSGWLVRLRGRLPSEWHPLHDLSSISWYVWKRFYDDNGLGVASALTYTSLLGLVPMLTIFLAILSGFPVFGEMRDQIKEFVLSPLVPEAGDIVREHINLFLNNTQQLTAFGVIGLAVTSFLLLWTIESAFNTIWRVVEPRPWTVRLLSFWGVLTLSPLIVGVSLSIKNYFESLAVQSGLGNMPGVFERIPHFIPLLMQFVAFSLLFWVIPHRRVRWRHCLIGGIVAALLFEFLKWGFSFYLTRAETYRIIYGALATIPIFLLWLYLSWSVILFGAEVAAAIPDWRADREAQRRGAATPAEKLAIAIAIMRAIWAASQEQRRLHREELEKVVPGGSEVFAQALTRLLAASYVATTEDDRVVIARDLTDTTLFDLHADLGLDIGTDLGPEFAETYDFSNPGRRTWTERLADTLLGLHRTKRELMGQPLRSYITAEPPVELRNAAE
jgi:membrane protein